MTTIDTATTPVAAADPAVAPTAARAAKRPGLNTETVALGGLFVAIFAFLAAIFAVSLAARAVDEAGSAPAAGTGAAGPVKVEMMEFMFMPDPVQVPAGTTTLTVENTGTTDHSMEIEGGPATPVIPAGESAQLDISGLAAGTYTVICTVPGHVDAGMTGSLTIG